MNKTLISIEELKQIALREIHTYPGCEDVSAVGIYPVTDEVAERNLVYSSTTARSSAHG
jgi:predicted membrane-bound spermidine synthase